MKSTHLLATLTSLALASTGLSAAPAAPAANPVPERIGIYDSRAVAFAHFWSPAERSHQNETIAAARAAKKSGDTRRADRLSDELKEHQKRSHLAVFSTAPADDAFATLAPRLPALQAELGVTRLVSKWDARTLRQFKSAAQVDVTDRLVREFITPTEKQQRTLDSMKTADPLPLWKARLLVTFGGI